MKIVPLFKAVAENNVQVFREHGKIGVRVDSEEYQKVKEWFIKGEYQIIDDFTIGMRVLEYTRLEKDVTITINRPEINGEALPEDKEKLDAIGDQIFTVIVFDKKTLNSAGKDIMRRHIQAYSKAVLESHEDRTREKADSNNFGIVRIDWNTKQVFIEKLPE